jgi:hypothetical protein
MLETRGGGRYRAFSCKLVTSQIQEDRLLNATSKFLLPVCLLVSAAAAHAQGCRNSDFRGIYAAQAVGAFLTAPGIPPGPTARVGRTAADGAGNASIQATLSLGGLVLKEEYGGTYTVNPDCTVTVTLLIPFPGVPQPIPFQLTGMLTDDARQMTIILNQPAGSTVRIILRKQQKTECGNGDLLGPYLLDMSGDNLAVSGVPQGPIARVGRIVFNGEGAFTATTQASYGGAVVAENFSGTYSVDKSCQFTVNYSYGAPSVPVTLQQSWDGMLSDRSSSAFLLVTTPGTVITGTLKAQ